MSICVAILLGVMLVSPAAAETIRIATWNLNNLHFATGDPLRSRAPARSAQDYAVLRDYVERLVADVIALQEVNGPRAGRRIFPESEYTLYFSGRYVEDLATGRSTDHIYTGFAVRRGVFDGVTKRDYAELSLRGRELGRTVRWGTDLLVERDGQYLRLLSVHLKSGCFARRLDPPANDPACPILAAQRDPLEAWVDRRAAERIPFAVLGDFNRAMDIHGQRDHLWEALDDGEPADLDLWRLPFHQESACWKGTRRHHRHPVDFLVFDDRAWNRVDEESFIQLTYDLVDRDIGQGTPSDHCPISVEIEL